jgi:hypothetical protein
MFSEVPDGTVKHALSSTTTTRATRGAISGEPYGASVVFHWFVRHVREIPASITRPEPGQFAETCPGSAHIELLRFERRPGGPPAGTP